MKQFALADIDAPCNDQQKGTFEISTFLLVIMLIVDQM
jgi:hypothetical protein